MTESKEFQLLGVMVPKGDKEIIREIAIKNRLTMSDVARMLISDSIEHIAERNHFEAGYLRIGGGSKDKQGR